MKSLDDVPDCGVVPDAESLWLKPKSERQMWLVKLCNLIYDKFVQFRYNDVASPPKSKPSHSDLVSEYAVQLLRLGCFYQEYSDAIREGDGGRLLRCWKYMLPMFLSSGNKNYAGEAVNLLLQHHYVLSPRLSAQLLWSRCVNVHGGPGKNIPGDLHMEHLNKAVKEAVRYLGPNQTEKTIQRVGRAIGTIVPILEQFDAHNDVPISSSSHTRPDDKVDIATVVGVLVDVHSFQFHEGRSYRQFPRPKNVLLAKSRDDVVTWIKEKVPKYM